MNQMCDVEDCANPAEGYVEAQWTIVDFVRYELCGECSEMAIDRLCNRTVNGEHPLWVIFHPYLF